MATLILTAVGTAVGGPIGAAVGALIGQQIDSRVFAPKGRQGPRLGELTVQTSSYGEAIPRVFGRMRVAGTVIWATDLRETRSTSGGGKGSPKTTSYAYSASFAVALSGRAVRGVGRIWADGKLLRGEAGDWKSGVGAFRLHEGGERQVADPLIAAIEGAEGTPAYRGVAYAVFEDLQLADFGNRIPSLSFEVIADEGAVPVAAIVGELGGADVTASGAASVDGYAVSGDSVRGAIEALMLIEPMGARDDGAVLRLDAAGAAPVTIAAGDLGASGGQRRIARREEAAQGAGKLPDEISITYYEPDRDWQAGLQRARRRGGAVRTDARELSAAMAAGQAKAIAERELGRVWTERRGLKVMLPWRYLDLRPGSRVTIAGDPTLWRVSEFAVEDMRIELGLRAERIAPLLPVTAMRRASASS
ncbi:phage tail protein [Sphingomonas montanisoli]|uniref:phage tail protein n=1 Tax=Sphingomonas montanisoli TaxID=2606412 RepID=UPI001FE44FA8|nr:phage tail protein [Sphingomonas montanisoli]